MLDLSSDLSSIEGKRFSFLKALSQFHQKKWEPFLKTWLEKKYLAPFLLWTGPHGIGKGAVATFFIQRLFCQNASGLFPCGSCDACFKFSRKEHVDFVEIAPDKTHGKIKREQIVEIQKQLRVPPLEAPFKVWLFRKADQSTPAAANALLKILEEPPPRWFFLMTSVSFQSVLPTIRSRAQHVAFSPLSEEVLKRCIPLLLQIKEHESKGKKRRGKKAHPVLIEEAFLKKWIPFVQGSLEKLESCVQGSAMELQNFFWDLLLGGHAYWEQTERFSEEEIEFFLEQFQYLYWDLFWESYQHVYEKIGLRQSVFFFQDRETERKQFFQKHFLKKKETLLTWYLEQVQDLEMKKNLLHTAIQRKLLLQTVWMQWLAVA